MSTPDYYLTVESIQNINAAADLMRRKREEARQLRECMSKLIAVCALLAWATAANAQDSWNGADKPKHIAASAISALIVESLWAEELPLTARFSLAMVPGVIKELADMRRGGSGFSWKDIGADAIGVASGMVFHGLIIKPNFVGINIKF